jgi:hypothetical protein
MPWITALRVPPRPGARSRVRGRDLTRFPARTVGGVATAYHARTATIAGVADCRVPATGAAHVFAVATGLPGRLPCPRGIRRPVAGPRQSSFAESCGRVPADAAADGHVSTAELHRSRCTGDRRRVPGSSQRRSRAATGPPGPCATTATPRRPRRGRRRMDAGGRGPGPPARRSGPAPAASGGPVPRDGPPAAGRRRVPRRGRLGRSPLAAVPAGGADVGRRAHAGPAPGHPTPALRHRPHLAARTPAGGHAAPRRHRHDLGAPAGRGVALPAPLVPGRPAERLPVLSRDSGHQRPAHCPVGGAPSRP